METVVESEVFRSSVSCLSEGRLLGCEVGEDSSHLTLLSHTPTGLKSQHGVSQFRGAQQSLLEFLL